MWSKLSPKEKSPYEQKAMKFKEKYEKVTAGPLQVLVMAVCSVARVNKYLCTRMLLHIVPKEQK